MRDLDEIIEPALSGLRELQPRRTPVELILLDNKRARLRRRRDIAKSIVMLTGLVGVIALVLHPRSAVASLLESVKISNAQAAIHVHALAANGQPAQDMWIFSDHFIRRLDHTFHLGTLQGTSLNLDDRLPFGFRTKIEEWESNLLRERMTGKVDEALGRAGKDPRGTVNVLRGIKAHGGVFDDYRITTPGCYQGVLTVDLYVEPTTRLIRFEDQQNVSSNGEIYVSTSSIEYPDANEALRKAPRFPTQSHYLSEAEIQRQFLADLKTPEQNCVVDGIRVSLYGVLVRPTWDQKALTVDVITKGGAGSEILQDHWVDIEEGSLSSEERLLRSPSQLGHPHLLAPGPNWLAEGVHVCGPVKLGGDDFVVNPANKTLASFPKTLIVRVPVWRSDASVNLTSKGSKTSGQTFHPSHLVGYATFVTHRILSDGGDMDLDLLGVSPLPKTQTLSR